jgi:hypothetical protein
MFCRYKHTMLMRVRTLLFVTLLALVTTVGDQRRSCLLQWMNGVVGFTRHEKLIAKNNPDISSRFEYCICIGGGGRHQMVVDKYFTSRTVSLNYVNT